MSPSFLRNASEESDNEAEIFTNILHCILYNGKNWKYIKSNVNAICTTCLTVDYLSG